jgi:hypothetical protein
MYVPKVVTSLRSVHVLLLSEISSRYFALFTKGMFHPFSWTLSSGTPKLSRETDRLSFPFIDSYVPAFTPLLHSREAALQFAEKMAFMLCRVYTVHASSADTRRIIIYVHSIQRWG